jgi:hypothetical protein
MVDKRRAEEEYGISGSVGDRCRSPLSSNWSKGALALVGDVAVSGVASGKDDRSIIAGRESPVKYLMVSKAIPIKTGPYSPLTSLQSGFSGLELIDQALALDVSYWIPRRVILSEPT